MTDLSTSQSPAIQTDLQHMVTRGQTSSWHSRKSARQQAASWSGSRTRRTWQPRVSATCRAIWPRVTLASSDKRLMCAHPGPGDGQPILKGHEVIRSSDILNFNAILERSVLTRPTRNCALDGISDEYQYHCDNNLDRTGAVPGVGLVSV